MAVFPFMKLYTKKNPVIFGNGLRRFSYNQGEKQLFQSVYCGSRIKTCLIISW